MMLSLQNHYLIFLSPFAFANAINSSTTSAIRSLILDTLIHDLNSV